MRRCGSDVRELLHDGAPTVCVGGAAFAYVNAFKAHVNVGFFRGAEIADPQGLLEGTGRFMRHVKLRPGDDCDAPALTQLIATAYIDMQQRVQGESLPTQTSGKGSAVHLAPEKRFAKIVSSLKRSPNVSLGHSKKGFGSSALCVRGKIFAMISSQGG